MICFTCILQLVLILDQQTNPILKPSELLPDSLKLARLAYAAHRSQAGRISAREFDAGFSPGRNADLPADQLTSLAISKAIVERNKESLDFLETLSERFGNTRTSSVIRLARAGMGSSRGGTDHWDSIQVDLRAVDATALSMFRAFRNRVNEAEELCDKQRMKELLGEVKAERELGKRLSSAMVQIIEIKISNIADRQPTSEQNEKIQLARQLVAANTRHLNEYLAKTEAALDPSDKLSRDLAKAKDAQSRAELNSGKPDLSFAQMVMNLVNDQLSKIMADSKPETMDSIYKKLLDKIENNKNELEIDLTKGFFQIESLTKALKDRDSKKLAGISLILKIQENIKPEKTSLISSKELVEVANFFAINCGDNGIKEDVQKFLKESKFELDKSTVLASLQSRSVVPTGLEKINNITEYNLAFYNVYRDWIQTFPFTENQMKMTQALVRVNPKLSPAQKDDLVTLLEENDSGNPTWKLDLVCRLAKASLSDHSLAHKLKAQYSFGRYLAPAEFADLRRIPANTPRGSSSQSDIPNHQDAITLIDRFDGKLLLKLAYSPRGAYLYPEVVVANQN